MNLFSVCFFSLFSIFCLSADYIEKSISYDANGNISKCTISPMGSTAYSYDPINRLVETRYPNGESIKYTYDCNSNLTQVVKGAETTSYSYDSSNRLVKAQFPGDTSLVYEYDLADRVVKITYPDREEVKYEYDHRGRLTKVFDQTGSTEYEYNDQTNLVVKEWLSNGIVVEYSYDAFPRITGVSHKKSDGGLITQYEFTYDSNNNCTSVEERTLSETKTTGYSYDQLKRLVEVRYSDHSFEQYTYDGAGNRLAKITPNGTIEYEYDSRNRLIRAGGTRFYYDASGCLVKKTSEKENISLGYDSAGRLTSFDNGNDKIAFGYDGQGRRVSKIVNGEKTSFINDPAASLSRVLLEKDGKGKTKKRYVYGCSRILGSGVSGTQFFLYDQPGKSVSLLVDKNQRVLERYAYSSFGFRDQSSSFGNPYAYAGEEYDEETGLIYLRNRYYDPEIGRFISPDSVLGVLGDPQTLNPYVYVRNNPVNLIDPSGLYAVKVPLTFYGNYPGTQTPGGKSNVGHGWIGGIDAEGNQFTQGAWPGHKIKNNEHEFSLCKETVSLTIWVTPEQQLLARQVGNYQHWTPYDNCIDHAVKSMDAVGYPHPSFKPFPSGISAPRKFCNWMLEESKHIDPRFLPDKEGLGLSYDFDHFQFQIGNQDHSLLFQPNYGGISLSKTAEMMTNISDIAGAVFDQKTGQMILYGTKDLPLPQMHLDDLAVAVRSVYGLGEKAAQDPGISMDPDPNPPKKKKKPQHRMVVSYFGETKDTRFGQVMFEADCLLKNLVLGKDNCTGRNFKAHVGGYRDLLELYGREKHLPPYFTWRMWFVPQKISLVQSEDGTSMVFDEVRMQVLTESQFKGSNYRDHAAETFASHFTQNYDAFANEFPVLQDLKRLGKITGVVKWIKDQNIPFDLSFFRSYAPQSVSTPIYTPQIGDAEYRMVISGGVTYHLDESNFSTSDGWQANDIKDEVLRGRSGEEELTWDFGRGYTAVAQTFARSLKVGNVKKTFVDMNFSVPGSVPLALVRTYSSFNEQRSALGVGWEILPAKLRFASEKRWRRFQDGTELQVYSEIFVGIKSQETLYKLIGLDVGKQPIYRAESKAGFLIENGDGIFVLSQKQEHLFFDSDGKLVKISDKSGMSIDYGYEAERLVSISSQGTPVIQLEYEGSKIIRAVGAGGKTISYFYGPEGQLREVRDKAGALMSYVYDKDLHLTAIFDAKGSKIFEASYDIYNRAEEKNIQGMQLKQEFSLSERRARVEGPNNFFLEEQFDEKYRPQRIVDSLGRGLELSYSGTFGPEKTVDNNGLEVSYKYDVLGRPIKISDAYRGERKFEFDESGNLLEETDGLGITTAYRYDAYGRLIKMYKPFRLNFLSIENGKVTKKGDERFATSFQYDPQTGSLLSVDFPGGGGKSFQLDEKGLPLEVCCPNGFISKRAYDDRARLIEVSESGKTIRYSYDERDRVTKISSPLGETVYSYDDNGNVLSKIDPLGLTSVFDYDDKDHLVQVVDALGGISSYEYSAFGGLTKITLPNGSIREILYDEFQRPVVLK